MVCRKVDIFSHSTVLNIMRHAQYMTSPAICWYTVQAVRALGCLCRRDVLITDVSSALRGIPSSQYHVVHLGAPMACPSRGPQEANDLLCSSSSLLSSDPSLLDVVRQEGLMSQERDVGRGFPALPVSAMSGLGCLASLDLCSFFVSRQCFCSVSASHIAAAAAFEGVVPRVVCLLMSCRLPLLRSRDVAADRATFGSPTSSPYEQRRGLDRVKLKTVGLVCGREVVWYATYGGEVASS